MASQMTEPEIQSALARVEQSLGEERPMDAIPDLQAILAAVPNHPGALCGIGRVSIQLGDNNAALHALNLALDQVPEMLETPVALPIKISTASPRPRPIFSSSAIGCPTTQGLF